MKNFENDRNSWLTLLNETPDEIFEKMKSNLLSSDAVDQRFITLVMHDIREEIIQLKNELEKPRVSEADQLSNHWMKNDEVLKLLGVTKKTLQSMRDDGRLLTSKLGETLFYKRDDVNHLYKSKYYKYDQYKK